MAVVRSMGMARAFQFGLQTVLEHRERQERAHQQSVAVVETERVGVEQEIRTIQDRLSADRRDLRQELAGAGTGDGGAVRMSAVRFAMNTSLHELVRLQRAAIRLAGVHQKLGRAREELRRAVVARKAVEALRERQLREHRTAAAAEEARELDDLAVMSAGRRRQA